MKEKWIAVEDRLPEKSTVVLAVIKHWHTKNIRQVTLVFDEWDDHSWEVEDFGIREELSHDFNVTHWQPLPEPPKK